MNVFNTLWKMFLQQEADDDDGDDRFIIDNNAHGYYTAFLDILAVVNFGDVQLIFRYYNCECECDYHVDKNFLKIFITVRDGNWMSLKIAKCHDIYTWRKRRRTEHHYHHQHQQQQQQQQQQQEKSFVEKPH